MGTCNDNEIDGGTARVAERIVFVRIERPDTPFVSKRRRFGTLGRRRGGAGLLNVICDGGGEGDESPMSPCVKGGNRFDGGEIWREDDDGAGMDAGIIGKGEREGGDGDALEDDAEDGSISGNGLDRRADPVSS